MQLALFSALAMAFACFIWMKNKEGPNLNAITQEAVKEARKKEEKGEERKCGHFTKP
ncbi:MAG: hypothetical protein NHB14_15705 [Desulfosporosinus sp.]|nr:hypothetical protein [Desulfosporosinus sp.]